MIFARGRSTRSKRNRRSLPGRSVWTFVLIIVVIIALGAGGAFWFLRDGHRPSLFSLGSIRELFRPKSAIVSATPREVSKEKRAGRPKSTSAGKDLAQKKKTSTPAKVETPEVTPSLERLRADNAKMAKQLEAKSPKGMYLIINTAGNRVILRNGDKVEAEMVASCGSGNVLADPRGGRSWTFDTPRGVYSIKSKITNPVWMKPDWAFIEEGEPIPANRADRAEPGMMGDFALGIGDGYFIHGTLYTRLLGRNVSHGCVRLGDADLERLYRSLQIGTQVFIY